MPDPLPLPFLTADVIRKKARRVYITYARFLEFGLTPGCSACENDPPNHSAECIARFEAAFGGREAPPTPALRSIHLPCHLLLSRKIALIVLRWASFGCC